MMKVDSNADRFADDTRNFVTWFQALPGATFRSDLIAVEDLRAQNAGRGIGQWDPFDRGWLLFLC
jgi:SET domain-containing protein 6